MGVPFRSREFDRSVPRITDGTVSGKACTVDRNGVPKSPGILSTASCIFVFVIPVCTSSMSTGGSIPRFVMENKPMSPEQVFKEGRYLNQELVDRGLARVI